MHALISVGAEYGNHAPSISPNAPVQLACIRAFLKNEESLSKGSLAASIPWSAGT